MTPLLPAVAVLVALNVWLAVACTREARAAEHAAQSRRILDRWKDAP